MSSLSQNSHALRVHETHRLIDGAALMLVFDIPDAFAGTFQWQAGQHITLCLELDGQALRRPYSVCVPPDSGQALSITVKRVNGGRVSNHINDTVRAGTMLDVMPPFGGFTLTPDASARRTHYFYAAGSGITPIRAMMAAVLEQEPHSVAHLMYGNASEGTSLFRDELASWTEKYPERFSVDHVLSRPGLWSSQGYWRKGRIDADSVGALITARPPYAQDTQHYLCGPDSMNATVREALMQLDVPSSRIHSESFGGEPIAESSITGQAAELTVISGADRQTLTVDADETLLQAMKRAGVNPPYACESGVCGACRARLVSGEVAMRATMALDEHEIDSGAILACQSLAQSDQLEVQYD